MAIRIESEDKVTGVGYYRTSIWEARDLLERVASGNLYDELEIDEPSHNRYDDSENFRVTIIVEKL